MVSTNQAMSRLKLFQQMAQGEQRFGTWAQEVLKQAKRCTWQDYDEKWAARDAILYQTTYAKLRKKILAENLIFEDTVTWGRTNQQSGRKSKQLAEVTGAGGDRIQRLEEQLCRLQADSPYKETKQQCQTCTRSGHGPGRECPAKKERCHACNLPGHFRGAPACKGEARAGGEKAKKKKKRPDKTVKRLKDADSSTETSEAEELGRIVEMVAAATDTTVSNPQKKSGDVKVHVSVRPRQGGEKTGVWWTADSGVRRTLLAERDWLRLQEKNPDLKLKRNHVEFRPYGTKIILPVLGKVKVVLKC